MYATLIAPPNVSPLTPVVVALQSELFTLLMKTLTPLADVNPDVLRTSPLPKLQAYPPRYNENEPPYELPPKEPPEDPVVVALQSELFTLLMKTLTPLADVNPDVLLTVTLPKLQAYPPRYNENEPPYELPPEDPVVVALQSELFTLLMDTLTPLADVNPDVLLLLLLKL
jgi:hypothetical protein